MLSGWVGDIPHPVASQTAMEWRSVEFLPPIIHRPVDMVIPDVQPGEGKTPVEPAGQIASVDIWKLAPIGYARARRRK